jgi:hypothetical protein
LSKVVEDIDQAGAGLGDRRQRQVGRPKVRLMVDVGGRVTAPLPRSRGSERHSEDSPGLVDVAAVKFRVAKAAKDAAVPPKKQ